MADGRSALLLRQKVSGFREVIDDYFAEAVEVSRVGNGWLTYSPLIHRVRESGSYYKMFDLLDEGPLAPTDIDKLTRMVLHSTPDDVELPELKRVGAKSFIRAVEKRLETAPTLVFNQTTPDGNEEIPPLPRRAWISYPRRNKHLLFRGNLQHGVSGELSVWPDDQAHSRMTLLVNWWRDAPKLPNCVRFEAERWRELGMDREEGRGRVSQIAFFHFQSISRGSLLSACLFVCFFGVGKRARTRSREPHRK